MTLKCECGGTLRQVEIEKFDFSAFAGLSVELRQVLGPALRQVRWRDAGREDHQRCSALADSGVAGLAPSTKPAGGKVSAQDSRMDAEGSGQADEGPAGDRRVLGVWQEAALSAERLRAEGFGHWQAPIRVCGSIRGACHRESS